VNPDATRDHYDQLAATYDQNWAHSPAFVDWMTGCILARLRLASGDIAADIGCGTGLYARGLAQHAAAVVCVDASAAMLAHVPASARMASVAAPVQEVAAGRASLPYDQFDAMLLKEMLHHVGDRAAVIGGLARLLRPGGRMLVVMLPTQISIPLFAAALERFTAGQPDPDQIAAAMRAAGLHTELTYDSFPLMFPTDRYLQMVRNRYMSLLSSFSDDQLEAGIAEIAQAHPGPQITFPDTYAFVLGTAA
jgi:ubiquinone/menaquinone biosynthesis C-methylase UbiE